MRRTEGIASILGVAQVPMRTRLPKYTYADLLGIVAGKALADAKVEARDVDGIVLALAPTALLGVDEPHFWGLAGLPGSTRFLGRVHMAAASGLVAFRLACTYVATGRAKRVLVVGADLADEVPNLRDSLRQLGDPFTEKQYPRGAITAAAIQMCGYMAQNDLCEHDMAHVVVKNRGNGVANEYAQLRQAITIDEVMASPTLSWPLKRLDSSPRTSGAAAVLVGRPDEKRSAVVATGFGSFANGRTSGAHMVPGDTSYFDGTDLARAAAAAYAMAGVSKPDEEIDVAEVYASFGIIELISIEALGLAGGGNAARMLKDGCFHRDSRLAVNPSGGATCGNPISSAGLLRVIEAALQLRGQAGERQVAKPARRAVVSAIGGLFQLHEVGVLEA